MKAWLFYAIEVTSVGVCIGLTAAVLIFHGVDILSAFLVGVGVTCVLLSPVFALGVERLV